MQRVVHYLVNTVSGLILFSLLNGCGGSGNIHSIPSIQLQGFLPPKFETEWNEFELEKAKLTIGLVYKYDNPTRLPLPIPGHSSTFSLGAQHIQIPGTSQDSFIVPPGASEYKSYKVQIKYDHSIRNLLGKEVPYKMEAKFELPGQLGSHTGQFVLSYQNTVRLPLLPTIKFDPNSNEPFGVKFTGDIDTIDLSAIQNTMQRWKKLTEMLPIAVALEAAIDSQHALDTLIEGSPIETFDIENQSFTTAYSSLMHLPSTIVNPASSTITGMTFSVPLIVINQNEFPITAPELTFETRFAGDTGSLVSFDTEYLNSDPQIPAKNGRLAGRKKLLIKGKINWSSLGSGLQPLMSNQQAQIELTQLCDVKSTLRVISIC